MRAGYAAVALALIVSALATAAIGPATRPVTVAAMLGLDGPDPPALERARAAAVTRETTTCMARLGFAYQADPDPPPAIPDASLDPRSWAARWGFGVSTSIGVAAPSTAQGPATTTVDRPASPAGRRFRQALYGAGGEAGCLGAATSSVYGARERRLTPLRPALSELDRGIDADAGMLPVRAAWRRCAIDATAPLRLPGLAIDRARLPAALVRWFTDRARSAASGTASLQATQVLERRVAVRIADCEMTYAAGRARVARPHEAAFILAHRDELIHIAAGIRADERRLIEAIR